VPIRPDKEGHKLYRSERRKRQWVKDLNQGGWGAELSIDDEGQPYACAYGQTGKQKHFESVTLIYISKKGGYIEEGGKSVRVP